MTFIRPLVSCLVMGSVIVALLQGCTSAPQNGDAMQPLAESCPEFAIATPSLLYTLDNAGNNFLKVDAMFSRGSKLGQRIRLQFDAFKMDGSRIENLDEVMAVHNQDAYTVPVNGLNSVSLQGKAQVKRDAPYSFILRIYALVTLTTRASCTLTDHVVVLKGSEPAAVVGAPASPEGTGRRSMKVEATGQPEGVAESCPEFLKRFPNLAEYRGGSQIALKFFDQGKECDANASNIKLVYSIVEVQNDGTLRTVSRQEVFGSTAVDRAREGGAVLVPQPTSKPRHVVITARCGQGCAATPAIATKTTSFWIVP